MTDWTLQQVRDEGFATVRALGERLAWPDCVLTMIAVVFLVGLFSAVLLPGSKTLWIGGSSALALVLIGDVLFRTPPQENT